MNLISVQDDLKNLSDQQLLQETKSPSGAAPQFMIMMEMDRRRRMRDAYKGQQGKAPQSSMAEELKAAMEGASQPTSPPQAGGPPMPPPPPPGGPPSGGMAAGGLVADDT